MSKKDKDKGKGKGKDKHHEEPSDATQELQHLQEATAAGLVDFERDVAAAKAVAAEVFGSSFSPADVVSILSRVPPEQEGDPASAILHRVAVDGLRSISQLAQRQLGAAPSAVVFDLFDAYFADFFQGGDDEEDDEDFDEDDED